MKKKQSRLIIYVVLGAAGILGLVAVAMAIILSQIADPTPDPTNAGELKQENKCNQVYVKRLDPETEQLVVVSISEQIPYGEPLVLGSVFQSPKPNTDIGENSAVIYKYFEYVLNNDSENTVQVAVDDPEKVLTGETDTHSVLTSEIVWDDYESLGDSDTLQIIVTPFGYPPLQTETSDLSTISDLSDYVGACLPVTYDIKRDDPAVDGCIEAGESGYKEEEIPCPIDEETGAPISDCPQLPVELPVCCEGLATVNCSELDEENQCTDPDPTCFKCLTAVDDGLCSTDEGENYCTSPEDCADDIIVVDPSDVACNGDCTEDSQCASGNICHNDICRNPDCTDNDTCGCDAEPSQCSGSCTDDSDCESGLACQSSKCVDPACPTESDCTCPDPEGSKTCTQSCTADSECESGLSCEDGTCLNPSCTTEQDCVCEEPNLDTSNFATAKSGPTCVERVAPNNVADFKITVSNNGDAYQELLQIKDKLPLGFTYTSGSAKINTAEDTSDEFVTVSIVGETQEIVWTTEGGWTLAPGEDFIIEFSTTAGENALTGDAINEVVITPENNPVNEDTLRANFTFKVEQSCTTPETGLLDSLVGKTALGLLAIMLAAIFYFTSTGGKLAEFVHGSSAFKTGSKTTGSATDSMKLFYYKLTEPRKHFEERFEKVEEKKRHKSKK